MGRVLLFGAIGTYAAAFSRALAPHAEIVACLVQRPVHGLLAHWFRHRPLPAEALGFACPVYSLGDFHSESSYAQLRRRFSSDLVISVGFPRVLPVLPLRSLARIGVLNLHPALLPRDRGAVPLFWALRRGDVESGVTLHLLTEEVDAGDVLFSARTAFEPGASGARLLEQLGALGGELVAARLPVLMSGAWHLQPQGEAEGPWARRPKREDLHIVASEWTAKALFSFVRGVRIHGVPWAILADDAYHFRDALAYTEGARIPGEFSLLRDELTLAVKDGTVCLQLHSSPSGH